MSREGPDLFHLTGPLETAPTEIGPPPSDVRGPCSTYIVGLRGGFAGQAYPIEDIVSFGRADDVTVYVPDGCVSRRHCEVTEEDGAVYLIDLESRNGTHVNGTPVHGRVELRNGDRILIGKFATFKFVREDHLERQVQQAQRLETFGRLASGIAHDFNNLLTVVSANAALATDTLSTLPSPAREQLRELMADMTIAARRGAEMTRQLLDFANHSERVHEPLDLSAVVQRIARLTTRALGMNLKVKTEPGLTLVGDTAGLEQVLLNLLLNARDASETGTPIHLEARTELLDALGAAAAHAPVDPGTHVLVTIRDEGTGMDEATQARVFEPFFTTKRGSHGTGLGLPMVWSIVHAHGGAVVLDSTPGEGTEVRVYLPAPEAPQRAVQPRVSATTLAPEHHSGLVLVIDDEDMVRRATARLLQRIGYDVVDAGGGLEGLELYRQYRPAVTFVLLDMTMPEMSGLDTLLHLRALSSEVPILACSGYSEVEASELVAAGADGYLKKPFDKRELSNAVLDARSARQSALL